MPYAVGRASVAYQIIAGKDFGQAWVLALTETGDPQSLDDVGEVEVRMEREGDPDGIVIWTLTDGDIAIADDVITLTVPGSATDDLADKLGRWNALLSIGAEAGAAEEPVLAFPVDVVLEPAHA